MPLIHLPQPVLLFPRRSESIGPVDFVLFNLTSLSIITAAVGSIESLSPLGPFSQTTAVASMASTAPSPTFTVRITFSDQTGWYRAVTSNFEAGVTLWIWCYQNGFVLTNPTGYAGQSSFGT